MLFSKCDRFGFGNANGKSSSYSEPVSQKSRNFSGLFRVPQFSSYLRKAEVLSHQTSQSSWFLISYIKNVLKDQLLKTSGLQFGNWLSGLEKFSGLSRNRPRDLNARNRIFLLNLILTAASRNVLFHVTKLWRDLFRHGL